MTPLREILLHSGDDYLLSLRVGALWRWPTSGDPVPANEPARRRARGEAREAASDDAPATDRGAQVFLISADRDFALVCSHPALTQEEEALACRILADALPHAVPILCAPRPEGRGAARTLPHRGQARADGPHVAAAVAVMNASRSWDESAVMQIDVDESVFTVAMLGYSNGCWRTEVGRVV